jgi:hypothetical protein
MTGFFVPFLKNLRLPAHFFRRESRQRIFVPTPFPPTGEKTSRLSLFPT